MTGKKDIIALAGFMRQRGEADACLNRLFADRDLLSFRRWAGQFGDKSDSADDETPMNATWPCVHRWLNVGAARHFLKQFLISPILLLLNLKLYYKVVNLLAPGFHAQSLIK